jgi:hypothetical protein
MWFFSVFLIYSFSTLAGERPRGNPMVAPPLCPWNKFQSLCFTQSFTLSNSWFRNKWYLLQYDFNGQLFAEEVSYEQKSLQAQIFTKIPRGKGVHTFWKKSQAVTLLWVLLHFYFKFSENSHTVGVLCHTLPVCIYLWIASC